MKFIIGLGNPGLKYQNTRHNAGFLVLETLAQVIFSGVKFSQNKKLHSEIIKTGDLVLAKPQTFMNDSGRAVRAVLDYYLDKVNFPKSTENFPIKFKDLFVVHDDLDLELGSHKIQFGKGPKVHNGLLSIYEYLETDQFWHVRVGIDGRGNNSSIPGGNYVLEKFLSSEREIVTQFAAQIVVELKELAVPF